MNAIIKRRENDLKKLRELEKKYKFLKIKKIEGNPISEITLELNLNLPISSKKNHDSFELKIKLPSNYPLTRPSFSINPVVFNPHVFESGNFCMGDKWMPSNTLDLEVLRVIKILLFYPEFINTHSPANSSALSWFKKNIKNFPLMKLENQIEWKDLS
jgi:ubiquitin-protein ligase